MTAIRPNLPSQLPGAAPSNVASARAAFFQAMNGTAPTAPVAAAAPVQRTVTATAAPNQAATATAAPDPARPLRPGSLLDIRV